MSGKQNRMRMGVSGLPHIRNSSKDIEKMIELLNLFGINSYEDNVPHIMLEFIYSRYKNEIK